MRRTLHADFIESSPARANILHGAVRSGKTVATNAKFVASLLTSEGQPIIVGKTLTSLERNVLRPLRAITNVEIVRSKKEATIAGRRCWLDGANDESAYEKIAGETLGLAYVDEGTLVPRSFWEMLISRLSEPGAHLFCTTNPGPPSHYLKKNWIDREEELDLGAWHFTLDDAPWLDPAYVAELKRAYSGLFYQRYILGLWVAAEGAVYQQFDKSLHCVHSLPHGKKATAVRVGVDYGQTHPAAFIKLAEIDGTWYAIGEYRQSDRTDAELARDLDHLLDGKHPSSIDVDPSAKSFRLELAKSGFDRVRAADNAVLDGISRISTALATGRLKILEPACPRLVEEIEGYRWDQRATDRGEDKPIKEVDDLVDALRYVANRIFKSQSLPSGRKARQPGMTRGRVLA